MGRDCHGKRCRLRAGKKWAFLQRGIHEKFMFVKIASEI